MCIQLHDIGRFLLMIIGICPIKKTVLRYFTNTILIFL